MADRVFAPDNWSVNSLSASPRKPFININCGGAQSRNQPIVIFVDGACAGNGQSWARAGMGVYFGPGSSYNISQRLDSFGLQTNQRAEVKAAVIALYRVRELLDNGRLRTNLVAVATDSAYLVGGITDWIYAWQKNGWTNARGGMVSNKLEFEELDDLVDELENNYGVLVQFWKVDRDNNEEADELARDATDY